MEWRTNLSNDLMMLNAPVTFIGTEEGQLIKRFTMRIPTVFEVYTDQDLQLFSSLSYFEISSNSDERLSHFEYARASSSLSAL